MRSYIIFFLIFFSAFSKAQEVVSNLISNPQLSKNQFISNKKLVVNLPFIDDFSYNSSLVDSSLWQNSSVFVNRTYPINPPTLGVATFDGLNEKGLARDFSPFSISEPSDTLLSRPIDMSGLTSAYLMFYFQGKGIGDAPQIEDKLILEFLRDSVWEQKWVSNGITMSEFEKVVVIIDSVHYLTNNFQFRFRNYATISGNFDHWHIDYVKLDELLSSSDTIDLNDVAFVYNSPSFLKRYYEMPWTHFLNNESSELKDSIDIIIRNNSASINVDYQFNIFENNNQIFHYPTIGVSRNVSILDYDTIGNFSFSNPPINISNNQFNSFQMDSTIFNIQHIIGTASSDNKFNDTLYHNQNFLSHFAYDDGTCEAAYGLNVNGAKIAYKFKLNRPDTLRAVQMYFPQMLDSVNDIPFQLTIWNDLNGIGNIVYQQEVFPVHTEKGAYHTYYIDQPFKIVGTFYVGWEQTTSDLLNIGLDKNNQANDYMFYNVGAGWNFSSYLGSWMIRPVLSMQEILSSTINEKLQFRVFPNPASSKFYIQTNNQNSVISIFSMQGVLIHRFNMTSNFQKVNVKNLSRGVYIVELLNEKNRRYQKIIVK
tara:strand:+ start:2947 stop:4728 length:1782 start_codon:yes stop_codon:yes gene_type:complete